MSAKDDFTQSGLLRGQAMSRPEEAGSLIQLHQIKRLCSTNHQSTAG